MKVQSENFTPNGSLKYNLQWVYYQYPPHVHRFAEIGYVIDGELEIIADGECHRAREGDFVFLFPMQLHEYRTPHRVNYLVCAFAGELIGSFLEANQGKRGVTPLFRCKESVRQYFRACFLDGELDEGAARMGDSGIQSTETHIVDYASHPDKHLRIQSCLYALLGEYIRTAEMTEMAGDTNAFSMMMQYLAEHYREQVTLASAAPAIGYSPNYLSHVIRKTCGMNFSTILGSLRVEYAQQLLHSSGGRTMLDVALECGFGTERSFHRMFKRITGCTPGEFMQKGAAAH